VEQVDRLSRLTAGDWEKLKAELTARRIRVVALDPPTSWTVAAKATDEFTARMFEAINRMLLDMLAAVAKDYTDRRRRQLRPKASTKAVRRSATPASPPCSPPANPGARYRLPRAAAAPPLPSSPSGPNRPPEKMP
jgi:DNA invertase Pin-like site-specific DNA recombinase